MPSELTLDQVDLLDQDLFADREPWDVFALLQREAPVYWHRGPEDGDGFWCVTRYDDLVHVLKNARLFSSEANGSAQIEWMEPDVLEARRNFMETDAPRHTAWRRQFARSFTPRAVAGYSDFLRELTGRMLDEAIDRGRAMMADAGLAGVEHNYPGEVSSGMRRRVEIVRALMNDPKVLLLDEPYRALDSLTKSVMHEALLEIYYKNKVTIFFITHDLEEAIFLGHRVAIMTTRPCKPKKLLTVDIPHPRDYGVLTSKRFRELMQETSEAVHEEARKAFQAGEKEG